MARKIPKKKESNNNNPAEKSRPISSSFDSANFPLWSKVLIGFMLTVQVGLVALLCSSMSNAVILIRQSMDPVYIRQRAVEIAEFQDPLPKGFSYRMGTSMFGSSMINILYEPEETDYMFGVLPQSDKLDSARQMLDKYAQNGIPNIAEDLKVESQGQMSIGLQNFEYDIASSNTAGRPMSVLIACSIPIDRKPILLCVRTPDKKINMDVAKNFFGSIKKFNIGPAYLPEGTKPDSAGAKPVEKSKAGEPLPDTKSEESSKAGDRRSAALPGSKPESNSKAGESPTLPETKPETISKTGESPTLPETKPEASSKASASPTPSH